MLYRYRDGLAQQDSEKKQPTRGEQGSGATQINSVEKLASLIDTEDPKYAKMKVDDFKNWETGV
jgi:hypothetical protein